MDSDRILVKFIRETIHFMFGNICLEIGRKLPKIRLSRLAVHVCSLTLDAMYDLYGKFG
jgi:hypothetical protein